MAPAQTPEMAPAQTPVIQGYDLSASQPIQVAVAPAASEGGSESARFRHRIGLDGANAVRRRKDHQRRHPRRISKAGEQEAVLGKRSDEEDGHQCGNVCLLA